MVDSWLEILMTDSSRDVVCSGEVPFLEGRLTRASFSTWGIGCLLAHVMRRYDGMERRRTAISKSTNFSVRVLISLLKQKE